MEKKRNKVILEFKKRFQKRFNCELDEKLFLFVVEKELHKKKESYLQIMLADKGYGFSDLLALKKSLQSEQSSALESSKPSKSGKVQKAKRKPDLERAVVSERVLEEAAASESEDRKELEKEKRRLYARSYYLRKKEKSLQGKPLPAKKFKTSAEQRAYQRSYYQRKKAITNKNISLGLVKANDNDGSSLAQPSLNLMGSGQENEMNFRSLFAVKTKLRKAKSSKQD